jgi:hypothetical protein
MATAVGTSKGSNNNKGKKPQPASKPVKTTSETAAASGGKKTAAAQPAPAPVVAEKMQAENAAAAPAVAEKAKEISKDADAKEAKESPPKEERLPGWGDKARAAAANLAREAQTAVNQRAAASGADRGVTLSEAEKALVGGGMVPSPDGSTAVVPPGTIRSALTVMATRAGVNDVEGTAAKAEAIEAALSQMQRSLRDDFIREASCAYAYLVLENEAVRAQVASPIDRYRPDMSGFSVPGLPSRMNRGAPHRVIEIMMAENAAQASSKHGFLDEMVDGVRTLESSAKAFVDLIWHNVPREVLDAFVHQGWV